MGMRITGLALSNSAHGSAEQSHSLRYTRAEKRSILPAKNMYVSCKGSDAFPKNL